MGADSVNRLDSGSLLPRFAPRERPESRLNPSGLDEAALEVRTLTNLYNQRPAWLRHAHRDLDEAVNNAYGWQAAMREEELLQALLERNLTMGGE